jgi:hypothetical protein
MHSNAGYMCEYLRCVRSSMHVHVSVDTPITGHSGPLLLLASESRALLLWLVAF